jgi:hypothetical protein
MTTTADRRPLSGVSRAESVRGEAVTLPRRRRSSLTRRILTLNVLALAIPVAGLLYLDQYRSSST